ncbi:NLR family CARD domain-containing protein 3 [Sarotherodon galilaeus]
MITGFLFLLFFMGGNASSIEPQDDQQTLNETITRGGNASSIEFEDDQQMFKETFTRENEGNSHKNCRYVDIINHLNLTQDKDMYIMTRPVRNYSHATRVYHNMAVEAILDVRETDQSLVSYIWVQYHWRNHYILWYPSQFCGLKNITFPTANLWMPDLTIEESCQKDVKYGINI